MINFRITIRIFYLIIFIFFIHVSSCSQNKQMYKWYNSSSPSIPLNQDSVIYQFNFIDDFNLQSERIDSIILLLEQRKRVYKLDDYGDVIDTNILNWGDNDTNTIKLISRFFGHFPIEQIEIIFLGDSTFNDSRIYKFGIDELNDFAFDKSVIVYAMKGIGIVGISRQSLCWGCNDYYYFLTPDFFKHEERLKQIIQEMQKW